MDGFQIFGRHQVFVIDLNLVAGLSVGEGVRATADLRAGAAVGARVHGVQRHIALAADGHAEGAVAKHLEAHAAARRAAQVVADDAAVYLGHLLHRQLARQHHHVGPAGVELQRLVVGDVGLGGDVHLDTLAVCVFDDGGVAGDDGGDAGLARRLDGLARLLHLIIVQYDVECQVGAHAVLAAYADDVAQVVEGEVQT